MLRVPMLAAALALCSFGAAAQDGVGRYQAVPIPGAGSDEVLLLDTRDGQVWRYWLVPGSSTTQGAAGITYEGKLIPGKEPGQVIQLYRFSR